MRIMLTAGYSALIVSSLFAQAASMPNMIHLYYSLTIRWPIVSDNIYAATLVLIIIVVGLTSIAEFVAYSCI